MAEFSKIVKFDFPRIPVLGTLLLIIAAFNYHDFVIPLLTDASGKLSLGVIAAAVVALGTAGVSGSHLISMVLFDVLFIANKAINNQDKNYRNSYQWFQSIQKQSTPNERSTERAGDHSFENRMIIKKLNHKQVHATLHALELECRNKSPAFGVQLEYYYSLYIFFFMSAIFTSLIIFAYAYHAMFLDKKYVTEMAIYFDIVIVIICLIGAFRARKIKEHLRITLFNHDRQYALDLLSRWYQCEIVNR